MSILVGFLYVIEVLVCLLLGLVVMLQKPKEGGLGGAIAGGMGEAVFGADASNVLIKATRGPDSDGQRASVAGRLSA